MRILLQNSIFYPRVIGGAEHSSWFLARELSARGHQVDVVASSGKREGPARELCERTLEGIDGVIFEAPSHGAVDLLDDERASILRKGLHHFQNVRSARWRELTAAVIRRRQPDVLHTNTIVGMTGEVWTAAAEAGVPVIHTLRDYHLLCPRTTLLRSSGDECTNAPLPCRIYRHWKKGATKHVDVVTAPSRFVLQRHLDHGDFPSARAEVVPNACPPPIDPPPEREETGPVQGMYLGQLDTHKGVALLLEVLTSIFESGDAPQLRFAFAGAGPLTETVRAFCSAWATRTSFHGFVQDDSKDTLLRESHFLVLPSIWNDNFPRVMLDAFRYAMPVLGARRGGIPEVVEDQRNGRIVEPTFDELRAGILAYARDASLRQEHGKNAHADAGRYGLDAQVDRFLELYEGLARV